MSDTIAATEQPERSVPNQASDFKWYVFGSRMVSAGITIIVLTWQFFRITGWVNDVQDSASAIQIMQIYAEGIFYMVAAISQLVAVYIFTRWTDR